MAIKVQLKDASGKGNRATISKRGEIAANDLEYSSAYTVNADAINTAYNFVPPIAGKRFVIKSITLSADKDVGVDGSTITIYEASTATTTTEDKQLFKIVMPQKTNFTKPSNILVTEGKWVSLKHDDDDVLGTIEGYYVDAW